MFQSGDGSIHSGLLAAEKFALLFQSFMITAAGHFKEHTEERKCGKRFL
jgi:hypothetical protein